MSLGARRLRTFLDVTLPLSLAGVAGGFLLAFTLAISAYATPADTGRCGHSGDGHTNLRFMMTLNWTGRWARRWACSWSRSAIVLPLRARSSARAAAPAKYRRNERRRGTTAHRPVDGIVRRRCPALRLHARADPDHRRRSRSIPATSPASRPSGFSLRWWPGAFESQVAGSAVVQPATRDDLRRPCDDSRTSACLRAGALPLSRPRRVDHARAGPADAAGAGHRHRAAADV